MTCGEPNAFVEDLLDVHWRGNNEELWTRPWSETHSATNLQNADLCLWLYILELKKQVIK